MNYDSIVRGRVMAITLTLTLVLLFLPFEFVNVNAQKTNSSSIKEIIDKVVSDTLDGMMNDTLNSLIKNTTSLMNRTGSPQNHLPSSLDISHIPGNLPTEQPITANAASVKHEKFNIERINNSKPVPLKYPNLNAINKNQNELNGSDNSNGGLPLKNLKSEIPSQTALDHKKNPTDFFGDIIQRLTQFFKVS
jgi:hypothetical protein